MEEKKITVKTVVGIVIFVALLAAVSYTHLTLPTNSRV